MTFKLFACGDVVNSKGKKDFIDSNLQTIIKSCDLSICNFEAPVQHDNMQKIRKAGPHLYQARESIKYLKEVGFNLVSLANNHIYDYGQQGLEETLKELVTQQIDFIGAGLDFKQAYSSKIIEKNDLKIGIIAACENEFGCLYEELNRGGYAWLLHDKIEDNIRDIKSKCDFIFLIAHAGVEEVEIPIKEWRKRYQRFCDIGVDVIIGHHPHIPQGYEKYKDSLIFYSLGNFYFDTASFENNSDDSYSVIFTINKSSKIEYQIIYHKKINNQIIMVNSNEINFDLNFLCKLLLDNYDERNEKLCIELFFKYYYKYYEVALDKIPKNASLVYKLKCLIKNVISFYKKKYEEDRYLLLLHNIRIDSHRFVVQRSLSRLSKELLQY